MSRDFKYSPIADQKDFQKPQTYQAWHDFVKGFFEDEIKSLKLSGVKEPQFYSEVDLPSDGAAVKTITWDAFPRVVETAHGGRNADAFKDLTTLTGGYRKSYDEYCELFIHYNKDGKISKIEVTSEPPEYYDTLYENEKDTLLKIYRENISPDVQLSDLEANSNDIFNWLSTTTGRSLSPGDFQKPENTMIYNMWNKWNTTHGAMHLHQINNFLSAEVDIAAQATALRSAYGQPVTESHALCNYARYGNVGRNSDPNIGDNANTLARQGYRITVQNPVGLYIKEVAYNLLTKGRKPIQDPTKYLKLARGKDNYGLRYVFEVPADEGFASDFEVNGIPIIYGPELLILFKIGITALGVPNVKVQDPLPFGGHLPEAVPLPLSPITSGTSHLKAHTNGSTSAVHKKAVLKRF